MREGRASVQSDETSRWFGSRRGALAKMLCLTALGMSVVACQPSYHPISGSEFMERWKGDSQHANVSWWYLGSDSQCHFIVEQWVVSREGFCVAREGTTLAISETSAERTSWWGRVNLKEGDLELVK